MARRDLVVLVAIALLAGLARFGARQLDPPQQPQPQTGASNGAAELLDALAVAPETDAAGYDRARFGAGWRTGPDGCDTRDRVLSTESLTPVHRDRCSVVAGEWQSAWDGARVVDPAGLDVDHLVALAEAWTSGASTWDQTQREAFANDLDRPDALVAVTASANRSKGDGDPAEWLPPVRDVWCRYATAWITQKHAWGLSIDPAEHQALADALATCPGADR